MEVVVGQWNTGEPARLAEQLSRLERRLVDVLTLLEKRSQPLELVRGEDGMIVAPGQAVSTEGTMTLLVRKPSIDDVGRPLIIFKLGGTTVTLAPVDSTINGVSSLAFTVAAAHHIENDGVNYFREAV